MAKGRVPAAGEQRGVSKGAVVVSGQVRPCQQRAFEHGRESETMAKQTSTVDTSIFTPEYLRSVAAERLASANGSRRLAPVVDGSEVVFADESEQTVVELPAFALDPKHVRRGFNHDEIVALSILGGRTLRPMPNTARAVMTAKSGKIAGADDGDIAVWDTDPKGIECAKPHLFTPAEWARMWSIETGSFIGERRVQEVSHAPSFKIDEKTGEKIEKVTIVSINGERREKRYGYTCVTEINGTDKFGNPVTLGAKRFFFDVSGYYTLVAPMSPTHAAAGIVQKFWPGLKLPRNNEDRLLLSGLTLQKVTGGRISLGTLKGNLYLNLPSVPDDMIQDGLLDPSLSVRVILANHEKIRQDLRAARAQLQAANDNQPSVAAPAFDYLDAAAPEYAPEQNDDSI